MRILNSVWGASLLGGCLGFIVACSGSSDLCVAKDVKCVQPLTCDPGDGVCKCGGRGGVICPNGFECNAQSNTCVSTLCKNVDCSEQPGTKCDAYDGKCKCGGTGGTVCDKGQACDPGANTCVAATSCAGLACPKNESCDPATVSCMCGGKKCAASEACQAGTDGTRSCVVDNCLKTSCSAGLTCDPADGFCKCQGAVCSAGQACSCPSGSDGGSCAASERACRVSNLCDGVSCTGFLSCDPADGQCKCGGPGGARCASDQLCSLGPPARCLGGAQCTDADGGSRVCGSGLTCDPEDGRCKCGGLGGIVCAAPVDGGSPGEVCIQGLSARACLQSCDITAPSCPTGQQCYFDSAAAVPSSYCAIPSGTKGVGDACKVATECQDSTSKLALHCAGLAEGTLGLCRGYCDVTAGTSGCSQNPVPNVCQQIPGAPANTGYCRPQ